MNAKIHWLLQSLRLEAMFRFALPLAARLPLPAGERLARALGRFCLRHDLDWRTVALRQQYVLDRSTQAFENMVPGIAPDALRRLQNERFEAASREEWEGHLFPRGRATEMHCEFNGLEAVQAQLASGRGLVLLTAHFDATLMGVVQLGLAGLKLNLMTSDVVEDPRVAPVVQRYFKNKYAGIEQYLNGGRVMHVETQLRAFYSAARRGEGVVILGDAPTLALDDALPIDFFGHRRAFSPGAIRIAEKTGVPVAAFICRQVAHGRYRIDFGPVLPPSEGSHTDNLPALFGFIEARMRETPGRWWAADQLPVFVKLDA
ncbi:MAG: hypothetical protein D3M94_15855 [Rhodocyclales bacterium GT-UBC]|nr:MAG: hypothetical protein D3M94_15855 [Rhodocyclales bacterium GT-UBC]